MKINRAWAMPNKNTFSINPIKELLIKYEVDQDGLTILDPFARNSIFKKTCVTNDLDDSIECNYNMDALEFLKIWGDKEANIILFDPPYSPRQVSECYKKMDLAVNMQTTQSSFWGNMKKEISRVICESGIIITCGWNSGGIGKTLGMEIEEILMVAHGGWHNDTIVTVERKTFIEGVK